MRYKNFYTVAVASCCILWLAGCSSVPILDNTSYLGNIYKRIPYKTEGEYRVVDIFYATSREI